MQRRAGTNKSRALDEGAGEEERRPSYLVGRLSRGEKKRPRRPEPLGTDAKNFNDDIPDPDGEVTIPE